MVTPKPRPVAWVRKARKNHLAASVAASLALHAFVLSLQFGAPGGLGLPLWGQSGDERRASIPMLNAVLLGETPPIAEEKPQPVTAATHPTAEIKPLPRKKVKPNVIAAPAPAEAAIATAGKPEVEPEAPSVIATPQAIAEVPEPTQLPVPEQKDLSVLDTDRDSTWSVSAAKTSQDAEARAREEQIALDAAKEAEELRRKAAEQADSQRAAELAAIAKATEEAAERHRLEEEKAAAEQAAVAKERQLALERARLDEEQARQAAIAKEREEALARKLEAEAVARTKEQARVSEANKLAEQAATDSRSNAAGQAEGRAAPRPGTGSDLASRALDQIRSGRQGPTARQPAFIDAPRRGSILGRDPRDIQLAFYGEGWRQKVERIGSLNYPKFSKNRHYDPLVVTVSINSDGTLAAVRIVSSSGHKDIDDAVRRIVEMSAPFAAFPPDMKRSYDVVDITRTWSFLEAQPRITGQ